MIDFKLDALTGDLDLSGGDLNLATQDETILQIISTRFRFQRGEWFLNTLVGAPLFGPGGIFGSGRGELETVRAICTEIVEGAPGIDRLTSLNMDLDENRALTVTWEAKKLDGKILANKETLIFGDL